MTDDFPCCHTAPEPPTWDAYNAACAAIEKHRARADQAEALLDALRGKLTAVADEYLRESRRVASGAVGSMLREWASLEASDVGR